MSKNSSDIDGKIAKQKQCADTEVSKGINSDSSTAVYEPEQTSVVTPILRPKRVAPNLAGIATNEMINHIPHDQDFMVALGLKTHQAARGLLVSALQGLGETGNAYRSLVLAMGAEMEPTDAVEAMLVLQIATTHSTMMRASGLSWDGKTIEAIEAYDRIANRLARTFATQVETLRRYRSGGEQVVRVDQVTVNKGGQAIVGNVRRGEAPK